MAFATLWVDAFPAIESFVTAAIRSAADASDVVQDVATAIAERFDDYDRARPFLPWAIGIAKNRVNDHFRRRRRAGEPVLFDATLLDAFVDHQPSGGETEHLLYRRALAACLATLTDRVQGLIRLRYGQGMGISQIASLANTNADAVSSALFRARDALATCIRARLASEGTG